VLIVTRRRLLMLLALFICITVGNGFVLGRRMEQARKLPLAHEAEEASPDKSATDVPAAGRTGTLDTHPSPADKAIV